MGGMKIFNKQLNKSGLPESNQRPFDTNGIQVYKLLQSNALPTELRPDETPNNTDIISLYTFSLLLIFLKISIKI